MIRPTAPLLRVTFIVLSSNQLRKAVFVLIDRSSKGPVFPPALFLIPAAPAPHPEFLLTPFAVGLSCGNLMGESDHPMAEQPDFASVRRASPRPALVRPLTIILLALAITGCQTRFPTQSVPRMNWLVMPFQQPPTMNTDTKAIQGWWLGARTIYQNPRAGILLGENCTRAMADLEYVNLYPSLDLRDYFARKREVLKNTYRYLSAAELDGLMNQVSPLDFARELGADKILTGRIIRQYQADNRTIHWWWSVVEADCEIIDVPTGKTEWQHHYYMRGQLDSMSDVQAELATQLIDDMRQNYFRPLGRGAGS
jgi:hypothetical protein